MAEKKGLIYRLTMGKDNMPDFMPENLPASRWALFKDVFFNRLGDMVKISLLTLIFALPLILLIVFSNIIKSADATVVPYSGNIGIGYPVVTDANIIGQFRGFQINLYTLLLLVPAVMIAGIGLSGAFHVMKRLAWGEGIAIAGEFFIGIKKNIFQFLWMSLFMGISLFILLFNISSFDYIEMNYILKVIMLAISVIQFVIFMCMMIFMPTQAVTYNLKFFALIKNSLLFAVGMFIPNIFFLIVSLLPLYLLTLLPSVFAFFGWMIIIMFGVSYVILVWTVYSHYVFDRFVNDRVRGAIKNRGMYIKTPEEQKKQEIERIKTRNAAYGSAYVTRKLKSIDEGVSFTPLKEHFSRDDLNKLKEEKDEMKKEIDIERISAEQEVEREIAEYDEQKEKDKKQKKNDKK